MDARVIPEREAATMRDYLRLIFPAALLMTSLNPE